MAGAALSAPLAASAAADVPVIDTHIHLWDPTRPQGSPFNPPDRPRGLRVGVYRDTSAPKGVVAAIAVEASPWVEDNLWLLEECGRDPIMVGAVGNLKLELKEFGEYLERYRKDPLYLGIRYGNVWEYDLPGLVGNPLVMANLKLLAQAGLVLEVANPRIDLFGASVKIADAIPGLRIVVNHLGAFEPKPEESKAFDAVLREFQKRPQITGKLSAFGLGRRGLMGKQALADYRPRIDRYFEVFGEDRIFGGGYTAQNGASQDLEMMRAYLADKPRALAEKFFWRNSVEIYRWQPRAANQPREA